MKTTIRITIDRPIKEVWKVLAEDFDKVGDWLSQVPKSYEKIEGEVSDDSPMVGRVCELSTDPNGPLAEETITGYDERNHVLNFKVVPINATLPVEENNVVVSLFSLKNGSTEVHWDSDIRLSFKGKLLKPIIKPFVKKAFYETLEEMKYFTENGRPHPRKLKKMEEQGVLQRA